MDYTALLIIASLLGMAIILIIIKILFTKKPQSGVALIRYGQGEPKVSFTQGLLAFPYIHIIKKVDITIKEINIEFDNYNPIQTKDEQKIIINLSFYLQINQTIDDVIKVANAFGADKTFNIKEITKFFKPKFEEAVKYICKTYDAEDIILDQLKIKDELFNLIGKDIDGYILSDIIFDVLKIKK